MISLNGRIVAPDQARIDPTDRGFLLADGLFETLRCVAGAPRALESHLARLAAGAAVLAIPLITNAADLRDQIQELLKSNGLAHGEAALRITLTRGPGARGLVPPNDPSPTLMMTVSPLVPVTQPASAHLASIRRNEHSPTSSLKTLAYLDNVLARRQAAASSRDEAIMLNTCGRLACASAANLFLVRGRTLFTPSLSEGVLPGITRAMVLDLAPRLDLIVVQVPLELNQISLSDEAFLTNSLTGVRPLTSLDGRAIGDGQPGPATGRISAALQELLD